MIARVSHWKIKDGSYDAVMEIVNGSIRDAITRIDLRLSCWADDYRRPSRHVR